MFEPADSRPAPSGTHIYRVFRLGRTGGITSAEIIPATSDEQAMIIAQAMPNGHGIELWERARRLACYPAAKAMAEYGRPAPLGEHTRP